MPQTVTPRDLKTGLQKIMHALERGEQFLLLENGRALAHLTPFASGSTHLPTAHTPSPALDVDEVISLLGERDVSRMLGLTWLTFAQQGRSGTFALPVRERLNALSAALSEQITFLPPHRLRTWWHRHHRDLSGRSPIDHLAQPWTAGDTYSRRVFHLIHQQRLLWELQANGIRPR